MNSPIKPSDIATDRPMREAFGNYETELSAVVLVRFAKERGEGWKPFTQDQLDTWAKSRFYFNRLTPKLITGPDAKGRYNFTAKFIGTRYAATPESN